MFSTTSPAMRSRRPSAASFNSNPDADIDDNDNDNDMADAGAGGGFRVLSPHPMAYSRPPRELFVRQSLTVPEVPRESFIPYSAFSYREPQHQVSRDLSYVDVDENMEIDPYYGRQNVNDEEFAPRGNPAPRPGRLRRLVHALLRPFRSVKAALGFPKFLRSKRRPVTQSSGWDFRDPTPAPPSIRMQLSHDEAERVPENVTVVFPQPSTAPVTMLEVGADHGRDNRSEDASSEDSDSGRGLSASHHSHFSGRPPSRRSAHVHRETNKVNYDALRTPVNARTSFAPFSPAGAPVPASTVKESSRARSSHTYSTASHGSSLLHHAVRLYHGLRALYHLPWVAAPPKRVAVDFVPALGSRSKYRVHRGPPQVPPAVLIAAAAAANMEPSEGKSWYRLSPQQLEKQRRRGKSATRHQHSHSHSHSFANPYQQQFLNDPRAQLRHNGQTDGQPMYMCNPTVPSFLPHGSPYGVPQFYMVPGPPPPPNHGSPPAVGAGGGGLRAPPPARSPSVMSFSLPASRPGPRPVQNGSGPVQDPSPDGSSPGRGDVQRPPPAVQPMYMIVQAPPGPPLPPSYGNVYPYPYTPPWTPPQRL